MGKKSLVSLSGIAAIAFVVWLYVYFVSRQGDS